MPSHTHGAMALLDRVRSFFTRSEPEPVRALPAPAVDEDARPFTADERIAKLASIFGAAHVEAHAAEIAKAFDVPQMAPGTKPTDPIGAPGLAMFGGYITSTESSADLDGANRWKNFETWKRQIAPIGASLRAYLYLVGSPEWKVPPYKAPDAEEPTPEDVERAAWAEAQLHGMSDEFERITQRFALAFFDGAALGVWTASPPGADGRFGLSDVLALPLSSIERWDLDERGRVRGVVQRDPNSQGEIAIARNRLVYARDLPTTAHPAGDGVMRFAAETVRRMLALEKLRDKAYEKDVNGIPIVYAPIRELMDRIGTANSETGRVYTRADFDRDMAYAVAFVSDAKRKDAGLILDSSTFPNPDKSPSNVRRYDVDVLSAQASSHESISKAIDNLAWSLLALLGFEHLAMGRDTGTQAMHVSKMQGTLRIVTSVLNGWAKVVRRDLLRPLWILNGLDPANPTDPQNVPTPEWAALEFADVPALVNSVGALLASSGIEPGRADDIVEAALETMGLPRLREVDHEAAAVQREAAAARAGLMPRPMPSAAPDPLDVADPEED